jgi:ribonuclease VapC
MNSSPSADEKPPENRYVLDASALLASILREPGAEAVDDAIASGALASTVNEAETYSKLVDLGLSDDAAEAALERLEYAAVEFTPEHALTSGRLRGTTRTFGLSLGDRACLALALSLELPVLTADRVWSQLDVGVDVVLCR